MPTFVREENCTRRSLEVDGGIWNMRVEKR